MTGLHEIRGWSLAYVSTPYSRYPGGIENAFQEAAELTGRLILAGVKAFSRIAHAHPIATHGGIDPLDHQTWLDLDQAFMAACDGILVAQMTGWQESYGVNYEIDVFKRAGKPVRLVDPETLAISLEPRADEGRWQSIGSVASRVLAQISRREAAE